MAFATGDQADPNITAIRLLITDTDPDTAIFQDEELVILLQNSGYSVNGAAALAYETWARDQAKLLKSSQYGDEKMERYTPEDLLALAAAIRTAAQSNSAPASAPMVAVMPPFPGPGDYGWP